MSETQALHKTLLRRAKSAVYTQMESEELNLELEKVIVDYYLQREVRRILEQIEVRENDLKEFYEANKERYRREVRVKLDTIFVSDLDKAEKILQECNVKNFDKLKQKYDERDEQAKQEDISDMLAISQLQAPIAEIVVSYLKKGIIKKIAKIQNQYHIIYLKDREEERIATYEEAKEFVFREMQQLLYQQKYHELIQSIANEEVALEAERMEERKEEKKQENLE